jgi:cobalamin biosynthesis Mg chelatase CobN
MTTTLNATTSNGLVVTPDNSGNILLQYNGVAAPAFSAYASGAQTITYGAETKITLDTEKFDTNNNFASSRFTPTVAGYYQINGMVCTQTTSTAIIAEIFKNGSIYAYGSTNAGVSGATIAYARSNVNAVVYLNGTTDYVELYGLPAGSSGSISTNGGAADTNFNGCLLRGA